MPDDRSVAIIIAARDEAALIGRAVGSALRQAAREVIVIDDGSTDGTAEAARRCDDGSGRLQVWRSERSQGPAAARNLAIARSASPYVCALDADDYMQDGRIQAVLDRAGSEWDLVADDVFYAAEGAPDLILGSVGIAAEAAHGTLTFHQFLAGNLYDKSRGRVELGFLKPLISRRFLDRVGIRYQEDLRLGEDFTLYAEALARRARFRLVSACGYVAVQRAQSLSLSHRGRDLAALAAADDRLLALPMLNPAERRILRRHRDRLIRRADHHCMLEAKRDGRLGETLGYLLRRPRSTAYILRETMRARLARAG